MLSASITCITITISSKKYFVIQNHLCEIFKRIISWKFLECNILYLILKISIFLYDRKNLHSYYVMALSSSSLASCLWTHRFPQLIFWWGEPILLIFWYIDSKYEIWCGIDFGGSSSPHFLWGAKMGFLIFFSVIFYTLEIKSMDINS